VVEREPGAGMDPGNVEVGIVTNETRVEDRTDELPLVRTDGHGSIWTRDAALSGPEGDEVGHLETTVSMVATCPDDEDDGQE
jgi:hypothetical protein